MTDIEQISAIEDAVSKHLAFPRRYRVIGNVVRDGLIVGGGILVALAYSVEDAKEQCRMEWRGFEPLRVLPYVEEQPTCFELDRVGGVQKID